MGPEVICWPALPPDKEQAVAAELVEWVTWLARRYDLDRRTIPECWQRHGALVEELSALRSAWQLAFSRTAPKDAPLTWHAGFAHSRARLADWAARTACRPGRHRDWLGRAAVQLSSGEAFGEGVHPPDTRRGEAAAAGGSLA
jgi:hypothetical protein